MYSWYHTPNTSNCIWNVHNSSSLVKITQVGRARNLFWLELCKCMNVAKMCLLKDFPQVHPIPLLIRINLYFSAIEKQPFWFQQGQNMTKNNLHHLTGM